MNGSGSSSRCACPTMPSTRSSAGSASSLAGARIVPREHLHVTLAFLGHRPAGELEAIVGALREAAAEAGEIRLTPVRYRETRSVGMLVLEDEGGRRRSSPTTFRRGSSDSASTAAKNVRGCRISRSRAGASGLGYGRSRRRRERLFRPTRLLICPDCIPVGRGTKSWNLSL